MSTKKVNKPKTDTQMYFNIAFSILLVLIFMQTCGVKGDVHKVGKVAVLSETRLNKKLDSISNVIVSKKELIDVIKETPAWKTLRLEEISDKEKISINQLEETEK